MMTRRDLLRRGVSSALIMRSTTTITQERRTFVGSRPGELRHVDRIPFCWCPAGRFQMGSPATETGHRPDEGAVDVTLTRGYWTAKYETTQGDWRRLVGDYPDRPPSEGFGIGDDVPVYWVNYAEAERFCRALTDAGHRSGSLAESWEIRLPTEAQWEYACRAGTTTATAFGDVFGRNHANFSGTPLNGGQGGPAVGRASRVGSYRPNPWDICDMHGNVFEWCRDWYHARLPGGVDPDLSGVRGTANRDGSYSRVRRGGAWNDDAWACRSALRLRYEPERRSDHIGFRVVAVERSDFAVSR